MSDLSSTYRTRDEVSASDRRGSHRESEEADSDDGAGHHRGAKAIEKAARKEVEDAIAKAKECPEPPEEWLTRNILAAPHGRGRCGNGGSSYTHM